MSAFTLEGGWCTVEHLQLICWLCKEQEHHSPRGQASNWHNWLLFCTLPQLRPISCNATSSISSPFSLQRPDTAMRLCLSIQLAASGGGGGGGGGHREGDKQQHSSSASELCVHVCMQTHLHLGGPCVCGALLSEGTIPCCVLLSCRCQLCPLNSYVSLCNVSVQPCGRKLSSESILLCFHNPFCYKSLTATPNQTPLSQAYPEVTSLIKHKTYQ